jgi:hypothetical protein
MSGHLRSCFATFVLLTAFSTSPASSNPFDFLFKTAPEEAAAPSATRAEATPARAEDECLPRPGKSTDGQYWVYRLDGHRKCWHQVDREVAARKLLHHRAATPLVAAPEEEAAPARRKQVVDARAELLRSAPVETSQPTPPAPESKVIDAAAVPRTVAAAVVPPAPVVATPAADQLTPHQPTPPQVDVDTLLAASDVVAGSVPPPTLAAEAGDDGRGWTPTWLGVLLMSLGFTSLLISSWTLRGTFALGANR